MNTNSAIFSTQNLIKAYNHIKVELTRSDFPLDIIYSPLIEEIEPNKETFFERISNIITSEFLYIDPITIIEVPKSEFKNRNIALVGLIDRVIYHAIFNHNSLGSLYNSHIYPNVSFSREVNDQSKYFLEDYKFKYIGYIEKQIKAYKDGYSWRLIVDIERFYDQIDHQILFGLLERFFGGTAEFNQASPALTKILKSWFPQGIGIPQGPDVSHVYSHLYLNNLDVLLQKLSKEKDVVVMRYQDDIAVMSRGEDTAKECFVEIYQSLKELKLNINNKAELKQLSSEEELLEKLFSTSHSDYEPNEHEKLDIKDIEDLINKIVNRQKFKDTDLSKFKYFLKACNSSEFPLIPNIIKLYDYLPHFSVYISRYFARYIDKNTTITKSYIDNELEINLKSSKYSDWTRYWMLRLFIYKSNKIDQKRILSSIENDKNTFIRIMYVLINKNHNDIESFKNSHELISFISNFQNTTNQKDLNNLILRNINNTQSKDLTSFLWLVTKKHNLKYSEVKTDFLKILDGTELYTNPESSPKVYAQNHISFSILNNIYPSYQSEANVLSTNVATTKDEKNDFERYRKDLGIQFKHRVICIDYKYSKIFVFNNPENLEVTKEITDDLVKSNGFKLLELLSKYEINDVISPMDKKIILDDIPTEKGINRNKGSKRGNSENQRDFINYEKETQKLFGFRVIEPKDTKGNWKVLFKVIKINK